MAMTFLPIILPLFCLNGIALLLIIQSSVVAAEGHQTGLKFNYSDPDKWGSLSPEFALCSSGKQQSPVNIINHQAVHNKALDPLSRKYKLRNATLINTGYSIKVPLKGKSSFVVEGKVYSLSQIHWHTPSEHRINGIRYPAELHEVHKADDGSLTVLAILYRYGKPDPIVAMIQPHLKALAEKHCGEHEKDEVFFRHFKNRLLKKRPRKYYRYFGSLTSPPCTEHVTWSVMTKVMSMSREQVLALSSTLCPVNRKNSRPVQPLHHRKVQLYDGH